MKHVLSGNSVFFAADNCCSLAFRNDYKFLPRLGGGAMLLRDAHGVESACGVRTGLFLSGFFSAALLF